jgi:hypothetical protein
MEKLLYMEKTYLKTLNDKSLKEHFEKIIST